MADLGGYTKSPRKVTHDGQHHPLVGYDAKAEGAVRPGAPLIKGTGAHQVKVAPAGSKAVVGYADVIFALGHGQIDSTTSQMKDIPDGDALKVRNGSRVVRVTLKAGGSNVSKGDPIESAGGGLYQKATFSAYDSILKVCAYMEEDVTVHATDNTEGLARWAK